jgi:NodT family efflux transporter outer membrane factor (OMF) lipoprotein
MIVMRVLSILLLSASLAACTVGPDYVRPELPLSPAYVAPAHLRQADEAWWRTFHDPLLDRIVDRVLAQNLDLAAADARIQQARSLAQGAGAALLPALGATAGAEADRQSLHSPIGAASRKLGFARDYQLYQVGAQASWEIDLFGGLTRERQAAHADLGAARADAAAVRLSIVAETVDAYLQLRGLQARLAVAEEQLALRRQLSGLVRKRVEEGLAAERDLHRIVGEEQGIASALSPLRAALIGQANRLDILMGRQAGTGHAELLASSALPDAPDPSGSANPADLMRRRPDIVAAERRLAAADARIGVAISAYYPRLSLQGVLGMVSLGTSNLLAGDAVSASGGAGLRWSLFDFGRVDAQVAQARGKEAEALALYRQAVLRATEDVETALVGLAEGRQEVLGLREQVVSLTRARDQTQLAYQGGAVSLLDVLDADKALLDASDRLQQARTGAARASVAATRALGGGYWEGVTHHG